MQHTFSPRTTTAITVTSTGVVFPLPVFNAVDISGNALFPTTKTDVVRTYVSGASATEIFVKFALTGTEALPTTTNGMPIPINSLETFHIGQRAWGYAVSAGGTSILYVTAGEGA